jgi:hypothetical protein
MNEPTTGWSARRRRWPYGEGKNKGQKIAFPLVDLSPGMNACLLDASSSSNNKQGFELDQQWRKGGFMLPVQ